MHIIKLLPRLRKIRRMGRVSQWQKVRLPRLSTVLNPREIIGERRVAAYAVAGAAFLVCIHLA